MNSIKLAVCFGAGNVGRGFIGELFSSSGWRVHFLDVNSKLVDQLHADKCYLHETVSNDNCTIKSVRNIDASYSNNIEEVAELIESADVITTSVGARVLSAIAPVIAYGLSKRFASSANDVSILLCENLHNAAAVFENLLRENLSDEAAKVVLPRVGLVETTIGRMIPVCPVEILQDNPSYVRVEPYNQLPYDKIAYKGQPLQVNGFIPISDVPFSFYSDRKLFVHNLGHSLTAYLGEIKGYHYISEAIEDPEIFSLVRGTMDESAMALSKAYGQPFAELSEHVTNLLSRFSNKELYDTVSRVGRDPARKLGANDRFLGVYKCALSHGTPTGHLIFAIAVASYSLGSLEEWSPRKARQYVFDNLPTGNLEKFEKLFDAVISNLREGFDWQRQLSNIQNF